MSIEVSKLVRQLPLAKGHKSILLAMADYASPDGSDVFPGTARLTRDTGYSRRWVTELRKDLVKMGLLVTTKPATWDRPTRYRIDLGKVKTLIERGEPTSPREPTSPPEPTALHPLNPLPSSPEPSAPKPPTEPSIEPPTVESEIDKEVERIFQRDIASGKVIDSPPNYKAGIRKRVAPRIEAEMSTRAATAAQQRKIDTCTLCNDNGTILIEGDDGRPLGDRCSHIPADYTGLRVSTAQSQ